VREELTSSYEFKVVPGVPFELRWAHEELVLLLLRELVARVTEFFLKGVSARTGNYLYTFHLGNETLATIFGCESWVLGIKLWNENLLMGQAGHPRHQHEDSIFKM
jgi:hypothetical protein